VDLRSAKAGLVACLVVSGLFGLGYALMVPFGEKPDEPSHMARIVYEARYGRAPMVSDALVFPNIVTYEAVQPPVYYWLAARLVRLLPDVAWSITPTRFVGCVEKSRRFALDGSDDPPFHATVLRIMGFGCAAASGVLVFSAAGTLGATPSHALLAATLCLFTPQVLFVSTGVNNDGLALLAGSLVLWLAIRAGVRGSLLCALAAGGASMLAAGVKLNTLPYLLGAPLLIAGARPPRLARAVGLFAVGVLIMAAPSILLHQSQDGVDQRGLLQRVTLPAASVASKDYLGFLPGLFTTYWARFGWMDMEPLGSVRAVWLVILAVATSGWILRTQATARRWMPLWLVLAAAVIGWMCTLGSSHQVQGRFLFPFAGVVGLLLARGIGSLPLPAVPPLVATAAMCANVISLLQLHAAYRPAQWPADMVIDAHQCYADRIVLETLSSGVEVGQTFMSTQPAIRAVDVVFTGTGLAADTVRMVITDEATGHVFREAFVCASEIRPEHYTRFKFEPIMKSANRLLRFSVAMTEADTEGTLSLRFALGDPYLEGVCLVAGEARDGDLKFVAWADKAREVER